VEEEEEVVVVVLRRLRLPDLVVGVEAEVGAHDLPELEVRYLVEEGAGAVEPPGLRLQLCGREGLQGGRVAAV
jgi:hypothetical protein